jgi:methionine synthase II (cobalamin-independent)
MLILDGQPQNHFPTDHASMADIMQRMERLCAAVPGDVELGVHLCYGDFGAHHMLEPRDMGPMVEVANAMAQAVGRPIQYVHMPVPAARTDESYFSPLRDLRFDGELFLGVIHATDGVEGTRQRMAVAAKYAPRFGIACECGIARARKTGLVKRLLEIHAAASA